MPPNVALMSRPIVQSGLAARILSPCAWENLGIWILHGRAQTAATLTSSSHRPIIFLLLKSLNDGAAMAQPAALSLTTPQISTGRLILTFHIPSGYVHTNAAVTHCVIMAPVGSIGPQRVTPRGHTWCGIDLIQLSETECDSIQRAVSWREIN